MPKVFQYTLLLALSALASAVMQIYFGLNLVQTLLVLAIPFCFIALQIKE